MKMFLKVMVRLSLFLLIGTFFLHTDVFAINFSKNSLNISAGKKVLIRPNSCSNQVEWTTNNQGIASVSQGGIVSAENNGSATITAKDLETGSTANITVNVGTKEPIRFAYVKPNTCNPNTEVSIYATTECSIEAVRFDIEHNGQKFSVPAIERFVEGNVHVWRGKLYISDLGLYKVKSYGHKSGEWKTCEDADAEVFCKSMRSKSESNYGERRISDEGLNFIASCEGFSAGIYNDSLVRNILNLGHGYSVRPYVPFYGNISKREGMALLIRSINRECSVAVNRFLTRNNVMFNQHQFDSLVSFTYNLGGLWMSGNTGLKNVLLSVGNGPSEFIGTVHSNNGINIRNGPGTEYERIGALVNNAKVQVVDKNKVNGNWYKVKTSNNLWGYCCADYMSLTEVASGVKNLDNVNRLEFIKNISMYHHAGGKCCKGLLTRRFWEADMFLYGEYGINGLFNSRYPNKHGHPIPSCMEGKY